MKNLYFLAAVFASVLSPAVFSASGSGTEKYFCAPDKGTGFYLDKKNQAWNETSFSVSSLAKFMVVVSGEAEDGKASYKVTGVGDGEPTAEACFFDERDQMTCIMNYLQSSFTMNRSTNRFIATYAGGYTSGGSGDSMIAIGKCSPI